MFRSVFCALLFIAWSGLALAQGMAVFPKDRLSIHSGLARHDFQIELAATPDQLAQGLMYRKSLAADAGMLFDFGPPRPVSMWMKNTLIPLDMLFMDASGRVIFIAERTVPWSLVPVGPDEPVRAVLELAGGTVERLRIKPGDRVDHSLFRK